MMFSPQKLHPISYISGLIEAFKQNIIVIIVFLVFNFKDFDFTNIREYIVPAVLSLFFLISFIGQILKVYQTRYWIENNHFILTTGIFNKERKELDISRIQSVDTSQSIELEQTIKDIQVTLADSQTEIDNNSFNNTDEYNELHNNESFDKSSKKRRVFKLSIKDLILMSLTSGAIGIAIATISPIIGSMSNIIPWKSITEEITHLANAIALIVSIIIGVILVASYIIGALINFIRYFGYTLSQENHQLKIQYGLFTKKNLTVPSDRIQAVVEHQSYIRKLFGYTAIHVLITSDFEEKMEDDSTIGGNIMIIPFIKRKEAYGIIKALIPEMDFKPARKGMSWRGFHRHFLIPSLILILIGSIGFYYWSTWALLIIGVIILALIIKAFLYIRLSGFQVENDELTIQKVNLFTIKRYYVKYDKIIGMEIKAHPFLIRNHLGHFNFLISKGATNQTIGLKFLDEKSIENLKTWYVGGDQRVEL